MAPQRLAGLTLSESDILSMHSLHFFYSITITCISTDNKRFFDVLRWSCGFVIKQRLRAGKEQDRPPHAQPPAVKLTFQLPPSYPTSIKLLLSFWDVSRRIKVAEKL
jgi:hypothetical protein